MSVWESAASRVIETAAEADLIVRNALAAVLTENESLRTVTWRLISRISVNLRLTLLRDALAAAGEIQFDTNPIRELYELRNRIAHSHVAISYAAMAGREDLRLARPVDYRVHAYTDTPVAEANAKVAAALASIAEVLSLARDYIPDINSYAEVDEAFIDDMIRRFNADADEDTR